MKYTSVILIIIAFQLSTHIQAQPVDYKNYVVDDGLLSTEVFHVIQDRKGYVWIATGQGVNRFDGYTFQNFTQLNGLPDNTVLELFEDYKGRIWFISLSGMLSWFENDSIHIYPHNKIIFEYNQSKRHPIKKSFYVDSADNVFISFYKAKPIRIDSTGTLHELTAPGEHVSIVKKVAENRLIYSCIKRNFRVILQNIFDNNQVDTLNIQTGFRSVAQLYNNHLLYSSFNKLFLFNKSGHSKRVEFDNDIIWLSEDDQGLLWVGFINDGVKAYKNLNFNEPVFHFFNGEDVSSLTKDKEGGYWFTTLNNGINYLPSLDFRSIIPKNSPNDHSISHLAVNDNKLWFTGGYGNYYTYDLKTLVRKSYAEKNNEFPSRLLKFLGDSLIISDLRKGTYLIYNGQSKKISPKFSSEVLKKRNKDFILFYRSSIELLQEQLSLLNNKKPFYDIYTVINYNKDTLWLGTDRGLFQFSLANNKLKKITHHKLFNNRVNILIKDQYKNIWVGTRGSGLLHVRDSIVKHYSLKDGLPGNSVNAIKRVKNNLWIGTNRGIARIPLDNDTLVTKKITKIVKGHGLIANEINDIEALQGYIFAATKKGISYFSEEIKGKTSPVYFTDCKINDKDTCLLNKYELAYNQNHVEISFVGINYQRNRPLEYYYKMQGLENHWRKTNDLSILYSSLAPGKYKFMVKTINSYGKESLKPIEIIFQINKPYYKKWWFITGIIVIVLLVIAGIFYLFFKTKLREANKRNEIEKALNRSRQQALSAQMNPHFIYNSLNSVQNYILKNEPLKSSEYLSKLGDLMRRILNNSQHSSITLQEELEALKKYVEMERLRFHQDFDFEIIIDREIEPQKIKVPPLIIQPYVENAIHHGLRLREGEKQLKVHLFQQEEKIHIHIEDNGIGREKASRINSQSATKHKSHGLNITNKRLLLFEEAYSNNLTINTFDANPNDKQNKGTRVEIQFSSLN
jgi:ligand-binding sensor domain-containing protein